jgi:hypothetical protein
MNTPIVPDLVRCVEQLDLLDGHLLGDACIVNPAPHLANPSCRIVQSSKHRQYIQYIASSMAVYANKPVKESDIYDKRTKKSYHRCWIQSPATQWLAQQRARWYPQGKKILPSDIVITQQLLLRFFLDDGTVGTTGGLYLATDDFPVEDTERLADLIGSYCNFKLALHKSGTKNQLRLYVKNSLRKDFLSVIGDCPVPIYAYKWE